jgi:glycosyltransferase involved in cell wall biosynthesis
LLPQATAKALPERPYFVVLGTIEGRKNHILLLNIWRRLVAQLGEDAPRLLVIGQRGWKAEQACQILDEDASLRAHVTEIGGCSDEELSAHLTGARALLFPSMVEGFGLPLVEALSLGVPVIGSDLPVFREIGQGVPAFLDPLDAVSWEKAVLDYARENSVHRAEQLSRLKTFHSPTWRDHFDLVQPWLETLM